MNINNILRTRIVSTEYLLAVIIGGELSIFAVSNRNFWMALERTDS